MKNGSARPTSRRRLASRLSVLLAITLSVLVAGAGQALAYGYHYTYQVAHNVNAEDAFDYLKNHFNSTFPAAQPMSTCGEVIYVGMECDLVGLDNKGHIRIEEVGSRHVVVRSLPGHVEGANKLINFTLATNEQNDLELEVTASGEDNFWQKIPFSKRANRLFANSTWSGLATNLAIRVQLGDIPHAGFLV